MEMQRPVKASTFRRFGGHFWWVAFQHIEASRHPQPTVDCLVVADDQLPVWPGSYQNAKIHWSSPRIIWLFNIAMGNGP